MNDREEFEERCIKDLQCGESLRQWLTERIERSFESFGVEYEVPRWWRICWLVACNSGSFQVHGWGCIGYTGGPFKEGLDQEEAMELTRCEAFLEGFDVGSSESGSAFDFLMPVYKEFIKANREEYDAQINAEDQAPVSS